jgi:hypothetical protein
MMAVPIASAGRFSPLGPLGTCPFLFIVEHALGVFQDMAVTFTQEIVSHRKVASGALIALQDPCL